MSSESGIFWSREGQKMVAMMFLATQWVAMRVHLGEITLQAFVGRCGGDTVDWGMKWKKEECIKT